jgi:hypothetical protein
MPCMQDAGKLMNLHAGRLLTPNSQRPIPNAQFPTPESRRDRLELESWELEVGSWELTRAFSP